MTEKSILEKYYNLVEDDDGDSYYEIDHELCARCIPIDGHSAMLKDHDKDIPIQWFCLGLIPYINNPKDVHEQNNRIRCCIISTLTDKIFSNSWTPWEAHRFGEALIEAAGLFLQEHQPGMGWEDLQKILHNIDLKAEESKE